MSSSDVTVATRVAPEVRARLEAAVKVRAGRGETIAGPHGPRPYDLSTAMRGALAMWLDVEEGTVGNPLENGRPGAARSTDPSTSKSAAADCAPRAGSQRRAVLEQFRKSGEEGLTTDAALEWLELAAARDGRRAPAQNSIARRVTDLLEVGAIAPAVQVGSSNPVNRPTRNGRAAQVWQITPKGLKWLEETTG